MRAEQERAFREFVGERALWLRRSAYLFCGDWHLAEDLVQATLLKLYRSWRRVGMATVDDYARVVLLRVWRWSGRAGAAARGGARAGRRDQPARAGLPGQRADRRRALRSARPPRRSVLVDRTTALASGEGAPNREAQHFRADGSVVSVTTSFGATPQDPTASGQDAPPLDSAEITALTTDPQLPLSR